MPVPGVDEGLELAEHLPAADLDRADLGDRAVLRRAAGGLQVDDDERDVRQGVPSASIDTCSYRAAAGPAPRRAARGEKGTGRTVNPTNDIPGTRAHRRDPGERSGRRPGAGAAENVSGLFLRSS